MKARITFGQHALFIIDFKIDGALWGVKFTSAAVAGDSPSNTELESGSNWSRVWENKNVRIVAIEHN